jgi:hypothetical protein
VYMTQLLEKCHYQLLYSVCCMFPWLQFCKLSRNASAALLKYRPCTYKATLKSVHGNIDVVEKQNVLHISPCVRACLPVCTCVGARSWKCACARVALINQHETHRHSVIWGPSGSTSFFYIIWYTERFSEKVTQYKMCFNFIYKFYLKHFSF